MRGGKGKGLALPPLGPCQDIAALGPPLTRWVETGNMRDLVCTGFLPGSTADKGHCVVTGMSLPWVDVFPTGRKEALQAFPAWGELWGGEERDQGKIPAGGSSVSVQDHWTAAPPPMPTSPSGKFCFPHLLPLSHFL